MFETGIEVPNDGAGSGRTPREALVLVVDDKSGLSGMFRAVCEYLNVSIERVPSHGDLDSALRQRRPMAVITELDAAGQDGCHVLKAVAAHDRDLPILLISGDDPTMLGVIDAAEEVWRLSSVIRRPRWPDVGAVVDFLFCAGRKGGCMRLMPT